MSCATVKSNSVRFILPQHHSAKRVCVRENDEWDNDFLKHNFLCFYASR